MKNVCLNNFSICFQRLFKLLSIIAFLGCCEWSWFNPPTMGLSSSFLIGYLLYLHFICCPPSQFPPPSGKRPITSSHLWFYSNHSHLPALDSWIWHGTRDPQSSQKNIITELWDGNNSVFISFFRIFTHSNFSNILCIIFTVWVSMWMYLWMSFVGKI